MLQFCDSEYKEKVLGCYLGKNIGGTLGAPMEWYRQINDVNFYTDNLNGEPLANDDLDIQLIWLVALEEMGIELDSFTLADYWCTYLTPHWNEYGQSKANMRTGLLPPLSGSINNEEMHSCGAFIRSEIWACIAPGNPEIAVRYAYNDAILDHGGNGEGTYAEMFCAAIESVAFVESNIRTLITIASSYIPDNSSTKAAIEMVIEEFDQGRDYIEIRDSILEKFRGAPMRLPVSDEDVKKGFAEGPYGFDSPANIAILVLCLLYGNNDFEKTICTAVNCGEDTDCTAATAASILGIINGISYIPEKWIKPIGYSIKTACINLGEMGIENSLLPKDIYELADRISKISKLVLLSQEIQQRCKLSHEVVGISNDSLENYNGKKLVTELTKNSMGPVFKSNFFTISVDYGEKGPFMKSGESKTVKLRIKNHYRVQGNMSMHIYVPDEWHITPAKDGFIDCLRCLDNRQTLEVSFNCDKMPNHLARGVIEFVCDSRPITILIPLTFINGDYY